MIKHAAEQSGIISSRYVNAEKEEATFNLIKATNNTLNHWQSHVINNAFTRIQLHKVFSNSMNFHLSEFRNQEFTLMIPRIPGGV